MEWEWEWDLAQLNWFHLLLCQWRALVWHTKISISMIFVVFKFQILFDSFLCCDLFFFLNIRRHKGDQNPPRSKINKWNEMKCKHVNSSFHFATVLIFNDSSFFSKFTQKKWTLNCCWRQGNERNCEQH